MAPFGHRFDPDHDLSTDIRKKYENDSGELLLAQHNVVTIAGRMIGKREAGRRPLPTYWTGEARSTLRSPRYGGEEAYKLFKESDLGDFWGLLVM